MTQSPLFSVNGIEMKGDEINVCLKTNDEGGLHVSPTSQLKSILRTMFRESQILLHIPRAEIRMEMELVDTRDLIAANVGKGEYFRIIIRGVTDPDRQTIANRLRAALEAR